MPSSESGDTETGDLRPEYDFDYRRARPNRFLGRAKQGHFVLVLDPDATRDLDLTKTKVLIAGKWHEFASDREAATRNLGVGSAHGLVLAATVLPLLQAYASDPTAAALALKDIATGVETDVLRDFVHVVLDDPRSILSLEKLAGDNASIRQVFYVLVTRTDSLKSAQEALGDQWQAFSAQLEQELSARNDSPLVFRIPTEQFSGKPNVVVPGNMTVRRGDQLDIWGLVHVGEPSQLPFSVAI